MSDQETQSREAAESHSDRIEATIQREWGELTEVQTPIDATLATRAAPGASPTRNVVVRERRVLDNQPHGTEDAEYELIRELGDGGMGVVYQARQASIGRSVAVKMLKGGLDGGATLRQKFIEEAAVTGELDHPNIVPIYDLGKTAEGLLFYAMKQVRGTPWKDVLRDRSVAENLRILMRVADAAAFAHSRGVVHRDLKPENIMLGEFGEVLVMDWGLALVTSGDGPATAGVGGTPCYMAPEMVTGPTEAIGAHSDVYLLGAILYEIETGTPPHNGKNASECLRAAARNEITPTTRTGELVEISRRALATRPSDRFSSVQEFQAAIREYESHTESLAAAARAREGLKKARETNDYDCFAGAMFGFRNAIDLWDGNTAAHSALHETRIAYAEAALRKGDYELGLSILVVDDERNTELRERLVGAQQEREARQQRLRNVRRMAVGLAVGLVVVMAVALASIMQAERRTRRQRDIAQVQQQLARDAVDQMLTEVGQEQLEDVPQMEAVRRNLLNKALSFYLRFLDEQPNEPAVRDETARAYHRVGDISYMLGRHQEAEEAYRRAISLFDELASEFPDVRQYRQRLARGRNALGELYRVLGNSKQAEEQYLDALQRQAALVASGPLDDESLHAEYRHELARTSYNLGLLYWSLNRSQDARDAYDSAVGALEALVESPQRNQEMQQGLARAYLNRGILNRGTDRVEQARQDYDGAIALLRELHEGSPANAAYRYELATVLNNLGNLLLSDASRRDETRRVYEDGVELLESLAKDFPGVLSYRKELANSVNSLAALAYFSQDFDTAEQMWQRSRAIARQLVDDQPQVPENHSLLGRTLGNLGSLMIKREDHEAARDLLAQAIESQQAALETNPEHPGFRSFLRNYTWSLTEAHLAVKDHESAARTAERLPEIIADDSAELYRAASLVARCLPLVDETPDRPDLSETQRDYARRATSLLARAVDHGFADLEKLDSDQAFDPVRELEEFEQIRQRLQPGRNSPRAEPE